MARTITETQYMELRGYEDHSWRWVNGGPLPSLVAKQLIAPSLHDRSMYAITPLGTDALRAFRARYGVS